MTTPSRLLPGAFFGETRDEIHTESFDFADREALVPDREVPQHTHDEAHFVLVVRGTYITEASNRPGQGGAGTLIFNPAGTTHRDRFGADLGRFFTISVAPGMASHLARLNPVSTSLTAPHVVAAAARAHGEFVRQTAFSDVILEGLGLELTARVAQWRDLQDRNPPRWLCTVRDSIYDRCTAKLTVRQLAAEARIHPIHLARCFRRYFGCSPGEYLRRCRMDVVRKLLVTTELPLAELALEAGFNDQSQLTNAFRQAMGITPGHYRRAVS